MKKVLFCLSAVILLATACKKDNDNNEPAPVTPTQENLVGSYLVTKRVIKSSTGAETDITTTDGWYDACERDNLHKLNADLTYQWEDAGTKCDPEGGFSSTWSLTSTTAIKINGRTYTIDSYNGKNLVLSELYTVPGYDANSRHIVTYTKQ